jgi:hypothetical protein
MGNSQMRLPGMDQISHILNTNPNQQQNHGSNNSNSFMNSPSMSATVQDIP